MILAPVNIMMRILTGRRTVAEESHGCGTYETELGSPMTPNSLASIEIRTNMMT